MPRMSIIHEVQRKFKKLYFVGSLQGQKLGEMQNNIEVMFSRKFKNTASNSETLKGAQIKVLKFKNIQQHLRNHANYNTNLRVHWRA